MIALIDGDILIYRAGYAAQKTHYRFLHRDGSVIDFDKRTKIQVEKELKSLGYSQAHGKLQKLISPDPIENACHTVKLMVTDILNSTKATDFKMYLTANDKTNYRFDLATTLPYKGNRTQPKPLHYDALREYLIEYWKAEVISDKEADDEMGIQADFHSVICTIDKDLDMIPGMHYNFVTHELYRTSDPGELDLVNNRKKLRGGGLKWFYAQLLLGDSADNIEGIPGYGPVAVYETLYTAQDELDMCERVLKVYEKTHKESGFGRLLENADLLWIQRNPDERKSEHLKQLVGGLDDKVSVFG